MEKRFLIQMLNRMNVRAYHIADILEIPENDVHITLDEEMEAFRRIEEDYYSTEYLQVRKQVQDMRADVSERERREIRRSYLLERIQDLKQQYLKEPTEKLRKELNHLLFETKIFTGQIEGISAEDVARARTFPISRLIQHRNMMALCPFHKDKTPSLNIKNNYYYCHGCNATGDVIDFVIKKDGISFRQAIMKLHH